MITITNVLLSIAGVFLLYIIIRVITLAVAKSWFQVKNQFEEEAKNGQERQEEEKEITGK